jgi:hypothetical protein
MDTNRILAELRSERNRIDQAISALEALASPVARGGRRGPAKAAGSQSQGTTSRRRGRMSAAARKRLSEMMKQRWAERKRKART